MGRVSRGAACSCYSLSAHIKLKTGAGRKGRGHREDQSCGNGKECRREKDGEEGKGALLSLSFEVSSSSAPSAEKS